MALLRKLFYKKPPDGLVEISERLYVFDCCFTTDAREPENYKIYMGNTIGQLKEHYPDASVLIFNFGEKESNQIASALWDYDLTIMDYPRQYEGCPLLPMEVIHHFLRSSESWLSLGQQNILLMHCERGGWPVLAYMLAALLIYKKQYTGEYKTLDMVYKQAPCELLQLLSPLNPIPSQLRYLQYVSRRNVTTEWPPSVRALTLDCVIIRMIPDFDGNGGCCPIFRIYGQDPSFPSDKTPKLLFSTSERSKNVRYYKQEECELVKIDINCHLQGDIVLECISLNGDVGREKMMYRAMFNTAFIRSNILILNRDEIDILWDAKDLFPMDFRAELLFSDMDAAASAVPVDFAGFEEEGLPIEAFGKIQEMFNSVDWLDPKSEAALNVLHQIATSDIVKEKLEIASKHHGGEKVNGQAFGPISDVVTHKLQSSPSSPKSPSLPVEKSAVMHQKSPVAEPHLPSSEQSQEVADSKVKPIPPPRIPSLKDTKVTTIEPSTPTAPLTPLLRDKRGSVLEPCRSPPTGHKTESAFLFSILHPSQEKDKPDNKVEYSQHFPSPLAPLTPPLKDQSTRTKASVPPPLPTPPPPPPPLPLKDKTVMRTGPSPPPLPPPPPPSVKHKPVMRADPSPASLPRSATEGTEEIVFSPLPPPPPIPALKFLGSPPPPPPIPSVNGNVNGGVIPPPPPLLSRAGNVSGGPSPPPLFKGRALSKAGSLKNQQGKKLKPLHWLKLTRAVQGSLWAEAQKSGEAAKAPEIDISELESLFSATNPKEQGDAKSKSRTAVANRPERVKLIDHRRAYNCEIMLSKVRIPLNELMDYVLNLEESVIDADQVDNLIKFCPTNEEMETLKGYKGEKDKLGKCEQFFLELMRVPRTESKLRVFSFKLQFKAQVSDLRNSLNIVNSAVEEEFC
uniref:formin-like protein 18 isoform X2 n=1 Tax=Erigeron canadensis TaxID=72917 RepID=UPI001CB9D2B9|nr:formin-like protein 18 isoform X2 [Erigeron canadensis]